MIPTTTKQWVVLDAQSAPRLHFNPEARIPAVGDYDVLVQFHFASLNYRDVMITQVCPIHITIVTIKFFLSIIYLISNY